MRIDSQIADFMSLVATKKIEIYNEFSLQHELGVYLRQNLHDLKVQFDEMWRFLKKSLTNAGSGKFIVAIQGGSWTVCGDQITLTALL